ncbi:MAG: hypothetical protein KBD51_03015 [Candidatus Levybacteria bacterium]|nr:hypothetical protein [Candidatus Levybacteria bacterium]
MFFRKKEETPEPIKTRKKEESNEEWDKKRLIITTFFVVVAILAVREIKTTFFSNNDEVLGQNVSVTPTPIKKPDVEIPRVNVANQVGSKINEIKRNIEGLNAQEVASSSPQIQKVLRDMEGLKDLPSNEAKSMCVKLCSEI